MKKTSKTILILAAAAAGCALAGALLYLVFTDILIEAAIAGVFLFLIGAVACGGLLVTALILSLFRKRKADPFLVFALADIALGVVMAAVAVYDFVTSTGELLGGLFGSLVIVYVLPIFAALLLADLIACLIVRHKQKNARRKAETAARQEDKGQKNTKILQGGKDNMDALQAIFTRHSVRQFTDRKISDEDLAVILKAGQSGPSCVNARDWAFLVISDKEVLARAAEANGRPAEPLKRADLGILVCGDTRRAFEGAKDYWIIDGAIAAQNMILAANALGIGSVWLGTYPQMNRVKRQAELFALPEHIVPHSLIAFGYEAEGGETKEKLYEPELVHVNKW